MPKKNQVQQAILILLSDKSNRINLNEVGLGPFNYISQNKDNGWQGFTSLVKVEKQYINLYRRILSDGTIQYLAFNAEDNIEPIMQFFLNTENAELNKKVLIISNTNSLVYETQIYCINNGVSIPVLQAQGETQSCFYSFEDLNNFIQGYNNAVEDQIKTILGEYFAKVKLSQLVLTMPNEEKIGGFKLSGLYAKLDVQQERALNLQLGKLGYKVISRNSRKPFEKSVHYVVSPVSYSIKNNNNNSSNNNNNNNLNNDDIIDNNDFVKIEVNNVPFILPRSATVWDLKDKYYREYKNTPDHLKGNEIYTWYRSNGNINIEMKDNQLISELPVSILLSVTKKQNINRNNNNNNNNDVISQPEPVKFIINNSNNYSLGFSLSTEKNLLKKYIKNIPMSTKKAMHNYQKAEEKKLLESLNSECVITANSITAPFVLGSENKDIFSLEGILQLVDTAERKNINKITHPVTREEYDISDLNEFFEKHVHVATRVELEELIREKQTTEEAQRQNQLKEERQPTRSPSR